MSTIELTVTLPDPLLQQARELGLLEPEAITELLRGAVQGQCSEKPEKRRRISELKGLGKEIWQNIDIDEFLRRERDSWD